MSPDELQRRRELRRRIARLRRRLDRRARNAAAPALAASSVARRAGLRGGWLIAAAGVLGWRLLGASRFTRWGAVLWRLLKTEQTGADDEYAPR